MAAVNYHFGGRDQLIEVVVKRHIFPVNEERLVRLDLLEKKWPGKLVPLEELLDAFTRPLAVAVRKTDLSEKLFLKLVGRILAMPGDAFPPDILEQLRLLSQRFSKAMARVLPEITTEELIWRMHFLVGAMLHMLGNQDVIAKISDGASGNPTVDVTIARFIRFGAAGLRQGSDAGPDVSVPGGSQEFFNF